MNPDFLLFFVMKRTRNHNNTAVDKIESIGMMISCVGNSWTFCEYMNRTGNNENKNGWIMFNFL